MASVQYLSSAWWDDLRSKKDWNDWRSSEIFQKIFPREKEALILADDLVRRSGEITLMHLLETWQGDQALGAILRDRLERIEAAPFNDIRPEIIENISRRLVALSKYPSVYRRPLTAERLQAAFSSREWALIKLFDDTRGPVGEAPLSKLLLDSQSAAAQAMLLRRLQSFADYKPNHINDGLRDALCFKLRCLLSQPPVDAGDPSLQNSKITDQGKSVVTVTNPLFIVTGTDLTDLNVPIVEWMQRASRRFGLWRESNLQPYRQWPHEKRAEIDAVLKGFGMVSLGGRSSEMTHALGWQNKHLTFRAQSDGSDIYLNPADSNKAYPGASDFVALWKKHAQNIDTPSNGVSSDLPGVIFRGLGNENLYRLQLGINGQAAYSPLTSPRPLALISAFQFVAS